MKYGWLRRALILLIAAGLCAGMYLYSRKQPLPMADTLTLWYVESDCPPEAMQSLITRCRKEAQIRIEAVAFPDEAFLGAAFEGETGRVPELPDLLFCSHIHAARLVESGSLAELQAPLPVPASLAENGPGIGRSFFPIGARLPVLLVNRTLTDGSFESLEALLAAAGESPFLGCDCWADFLYTQAAAKGIQLSGDLDEDLKDPWAAALYNALALGVFRGGFIRLDDPAAYVKQGQLACAVVRSTALAGLKTADGTLEARLLPLPVGTDARYPAELVGFALLNGAETDAAERFIRWLWSGPGTQTGLAAGLVPFAQPSAGTGTDSVLAPLAKDSAFFLPDPDGPFLRNREACEAWLRQALDLLA